MQICKNDTNKETKLGFLKLFKSILDIKKKDDIFINDKYFHKYEVVLDTGLFNNDNKYKYLNLNNAFVKSTELLKKDLKTIRINLYLDKNNNSIKKIDSNILIPNSNFMIKYNYKENDLIENDFINKPETTLSFTQIMYNNLKKQQ